MAKKELSAEEKATRDRLRKLTIGAPAVAPSRIVKWGADEGGVQGEYEVRAPSLRTQERLQKQASDSNLKMMFLSLIECVYLPGTDIQVFEASDEEGMGNRTLKDFVGVFTKAILELAKEADFELAEKNS